MIDDMLREKCQQLSDAYHQFPLGVTIEDYSGVKRGVDNLLNDGVENLGLHLREHFDVLSELVQSIKIIYANDSMLKLFRVKNLKEYIDLDSELIKESDWIDFFVQEIVGLTNTGTHSGEYSEALRNKTSVNFKCNSWIHSDHRNDWSLVVSIHEDVAEKIKTKALLDERNLQIQQALNLASLGTWIWDFTNDEYEYVSSELAKIYGYDVDGLLAASKKSGSYMYGVHLDDVADVVQAMEESIINHEVYRVVYRIIQKDGTIRTVSDTCQHFYNSDGTCYRSIGCMQDITVFMDAQINYRWAAEIGNLGHYIWDELKNECESCSPELAHICGMTADEYIEISKNHNMNNEMIHPDDRQLYVAKTNNYDIDLDVIYRIIHRNGETVYVREYGRRILDKDGNVIKTHGIIQDITEEKNIEEALQLALRDAERANQAKSEFLATMSHEFRTPLNAILGFSEMMRAQYFGPLGSDNYKDYANDIHNSGEHMLSLVNDVLDIAAIEAGKRPLIKENIDVREMINDSIRNVDQSAKNAELNLSCVIPDDLPNLYADKRSISQIFLNLLSNAIKFTLPNGEIIVSAKASDQVFSISFQDTGIGIPSDRIADITKPFSQINNEAFLAKDGTGLGLSIVEYLVKAHDGELDIQSEEGKGTLVMVSFPLQVIDLN